jgi:stage II sporulation protein D
MLSVEPYIRVGIIDGCDGVQGALQGGFTAGEGELLEGEFSVAMQNGAALFSTVRGVFRSKDEVVLRPAPGSRFVLRDVTIGIDFHWERKEDQIFEGVLRLVARPDGRLAVINEISVEEYLKSVISSEMSAEAPLELLKAHAITSRSWLVAMLERERKNVGVNPQRGWERDTEIIRWYDREDHDLFDVCADDHCQRYQGITRIISQAAASAVESTRGIFLVYNDEVCDARFSKSCGGISEMFENAWEEKHIPYLESVSDAPIEHRPLTDEAGAGQWIRSTPEAYCNTQDPQLLQQILPSFDRETADFFRWSVDYRRDELEEIVRRKSGIDFGTLLNLVPVKRGPSGRLVKLRIEGTKRTLTVGKELEIRRWLSNSHLYSSAFVVERELDRSGVPVRFILRGAGWGHGVGLCQIGAAVMAAKGKTAEEIVKHYFRGAEVRKLY